MTTKTSLLFPYDTLNHVICCKLHVRHAAITGAIYNLNISILVVLLYSWRVQVNIKKYEDLQDVYYGVQIAYFSIIGSQLFLVFLSILLLIGIIKEKTGLIVPWVIGFIALMALEAVSVVYSNVLRDHVNKVCMFYSKNSKDACLNSINFSHILDIKLCKRESRSKYIRQFCLLLYFFGNQFDALCKAEMAFFLTRVVLNILALYGVMKYYNLLRAGITWKGPEAIEL